MVAILISPRMGALGRKFCSISGLCLVAFSRAHCVLMACVFVTRSLLEFSCPSWALKAKNVERAKFLHSPLGVPLVILLVSLLPIRLFSDLFLFYDVMQFQISSPLGFFELLAAADFRPRTALAVSPPRLWSAIRDSAQRRP